jgi:phospholipase C
VPVHLTRRELLAAGAAGGAGLALGGLGPSALRALAAPPVCGKLSDIEHVVILIQENRSFDHYFGSYRGVRGFSDPSVPQSHGYPVWYQSDNGLMPPFGPPSGYLAPFHIDSFNTAGTGECTNDITHDWVPQHAAWNSGAMDQFLKAHLDDTANAANAPMTMGYYSRADIAYYYALADAFTLCDAYHCSVIGPTDPNRLMSMSATIDPAGANGGPWLQTLLNRTPELFKLTWPTYPEQLQANSVSWKVYSDPSGHYGDNVLAYFKNYASTVNPTLFANAFSSTFLSHGAPGTFEADCASGILPQVAWVLAPLIDSEHPPAPTVWGEAATAQVLNALTGNPALWAKTVLFVTHDENGGFFDHVPPPTAPPNTPGEYITTALNLPSPRDAGGVAGPIGLGFRVPLLVCSPFSRGGFVCHDTFDHTSLLLFLERRFGVEVPNITAWRRQTVGDLTAALNMAAVDASVPLIAQPSFSDARVLGTNSDCPVNAPSDLIDAGLPTVTHYANPQPNPPLPAQETGTAQSPSGLSCGPANAVPSGPPSLLLASAAAVLAGAAALAGRRTTVEAEPTQ